MDTADRTIVGLIILLAILAIGVYIFSNARTGYMEPSYTYTPSYPPSSRSYSSSASNYNYSYGLPASAYSSSYYYVPGSPTTTTYYTTMDQGSIY